ncbi:MULTISPECIES: cytochrome o ubiquinol oxidase subunit IV [Vibrio]|uniref:Cytochrome bo(3) ubiquinol oxidase subunit 4 n=1 Tax=Vibrio casei TaxID=673372 RepID=A0A368LQP6_9VIBR|nr:MULTISPECIES: cytochrome o ubiquinol oxidase subunit IV [Vibrio]RCS73803.1 cytochrome o ubiquinol oxidase subunit IV [Vibrio casei]SJN35088.1 Cytochrome O ubiquinol oxidase subunit IV [Vibrio casei]HBV77297.1 cytochrome o ubiquinol oxidase subunit IV [Vibrio sp.]
MAHQSVSDKAHQDSGAKGYITGFVLSLVLTMIPFYFAYTGVLPRETTIEILIITAVLQLVVHLFYFLHMDSSERGIFNMVSFVFTAVIVFIVIAGSIWIMWNLNHNMMM